MTNVDVEFIKDLDECLKIADQLSKLDTEEAKLFVSQQLNELHTFLQKKQRDAEDRIEEEMKKEEDEIVQLKKRIERATTGDGDNESDIAYTDLNMLWSNLKDEYWRLTFNAFICETNFEVKEILDHLIGILLESFSMCKEKANKSRKDMMFQVYYPGEDPSNKNLKLPKEHDQNLEGLCRRCQLRSTPFCIASVREAIVSDVKTKKEVLKHLKYKSKELSTEIKKYLDKCVEFCWVACLEEPEIQLITKPKQECPKIASEFIDLDRTIYRSRQNAAYVEWPAVVQGNKVRVQWQLYPMNQPRPEPKDLRGEQSLDYRASGIEGTDGRLKDDPDDKVKDEDNTTSILSDKGTGKAKGNKSESTDKRYSVNEKGKVKEKNSGKGYSKKQRGHPNIENI